MQLISEAMPDHSESQGESTRSRPQTPFLWGHCARQTAGKRGPGSTKIWLIALTISLVATIWPANLQAQDGINSRSFDIGIIIDNRPLPTGETIRPDIDEVFRMLDQQMYIEHILVLERPSIGEICGIFGCPKALKGTNPYEPLLEQIMLEEQSRAVVYYIGEGRIEGLERQLLFLRRNRSPNTDVVGFPVDWLHDALTERKPASAMIMLDTSFSPTGLPCAGSNAETINRALTRARQAYWRIASNFRGPATTTEISGTTAVQPPRCGQGGQASPDEDASLFTQFLLEAIVDGEADLEPIGDDDHLVDLGELYTYIDESLNRVAQFQWGRGEHVFIDGPRKRSLASVDRRDLRPENQQMLARLTTSPEDQSAKDDTPPEEEEQPTVEDVATRTEDRRAHCANDPMATDCHPCVLDPAGQDCADLCLSGEASGLCAEGLTTGPEVDADDTVRESHTVDVIAVKIDESQAFDERSFACDLAVDHIAPFASVLVQRIGDGTSSSCSWARDRSDVELGPIGKIFTPIAWRLGRSNVQDAVSCLLDCDHTLETNTAIAADKPDQLLQPIAEQPREPYVDPRTFDPFNLSICDQLHEPLPPYLGLPRWMPGTLIISEGLRMAYGCPPLPTEPSLPVPVVVAIEAPIIEEPAEPAADPSPALLAAEDGRTEPMYQAADADPMTVGDEVQPVEAAPGFDVADAALSGDDDQLNDEPLIEEDPFIQSASDVRWLQSALTVDNRNPGPIDGMMGGKTIDAIRSWRRDNGDARRTGDLTEVEFQDIMEAFHDRFPHVMERSLPL